MKTRIRKAFLYVPAKINDKWIWLKSVHIKETLMYGGFEGLPTWRFVDFATPLEIALDEN